MLFFIVTSVILSIAGSSSIRLPRTETEESSFENEVSPSSYEFVSRAGWDARAPNSKAALNVPIPYVVIHHSYTPKACYNKDQCSKAMRSMQNFHMDDNGWADIGYNFGVGSDGVAYEGRGWTTLGAHALHFNTVSIGICLIGDWRESLPPAVQLDTTKALIADGVNKGYISPDYKLVGHRQVRATECPGDALYRAIQTWPHYVDFPRNHRDLKNVTELSEWIRFKL